MRNGLVERFVPGGACTEPAQGTDDARVTDQRQGLDVAVSAASTCPGADATFESHERFAARGTDVAPGGEPCFVAAAIPALDLVPAAALPFAKIDFRQPVIDAQDGLQEPGKLVGHFAAAPQRTRPDRQRGRPREGERKTARACARVLARGQVEPPVTAVGDRDRGMPCAQEEAHRTPLPHQRASVSRRVHSTTCSVAPRKSPVNPPSRRIKRMPHATAVRPATASRPTSKLHSRNPVTAAPPKSSAIQPPATAPSAPPARTTPPLLPPSRATEGQIAPRHTRGRRA